MKKKTTNQLLEEILIELKKQNHSSETGGGTWTYPQYPYQTPNQSYCSRCGQWYYGLHSCSGIMGTSNITC